MSTRALPVDPLTGLLDTSRLGRGPGLAHGLAAVIAVHLRGVTCDVPDLARTRPGLPIVEDAAQAWAARYPDGTAVGSASDACAFSFGAATSPSAGELGCLVTRTSDLHRKAVELTQHPVRQVLTGIVDPTNDQPMMRVAPAVALLGAYAVQRHASQVPVLRMAAARLANALRQADLRVLSDAAVGIPGVVAVVATPAHVRAAARDLSLGRGVVITSVDRSPLHVHPDLAEDPALTELAEAVTTVTVACRRRTRNSRESFPST